MSTPPLQPQATPVRPAPDPRRPVTLPTWVNVVLVLILLVSCGAANDSTPTPPDAGEVASQVVQQLQSDGTGIAPASGEDVQDLCRLMGAVLVGQKQKVDAVVGADSTTACAEAAREGAAR